MHNHKSYSPYRIVSRLIEQSTWGGRFILEHKQLDNIDSLADKKVGQSYELFGRSRLVPIAQQSTENLYELGSAEGNRIAETNVSHAYALSQLIESDAAGVLGKVVLERYGSQMPLLLKLNQALGNSFQLHIKLTQEIPDVVARAKQNPYAQPQQIGGWLAKPESWYYLRPGLATLGLKSDANLKEYEAACQSIDARMHALSVEIKRKKLSREEAQTIASDFIQEIDPWQFVNRVAIRTGQVVDLSRGGIHHSWEEDLKHFPDGNIVYEIQLDRMDTLATIRAFDQGKIKPDGSVRALAIEEYFRYLDADPVRNDPAKLVYDPLPAAAGEVGQSLVANPHYSLREIFLSGNNKSFTEDTQRLSFHHLFCEKGAVVLITGQGRYQVAQGASIFLPAGVGRYTIENTDEESRILSAHVSEEG